MRPGSVPVPRGALPARISRFCQGSPAMEDRASGSAPTSWYGLNFPGIVDWLLNDEWRSWDDGDSVEPGDEEVETWQALHREIVGEYGRGDTLNTYLQRLDLSSRTPPPAPKAVQCVTVHRAKGLEFSHVYLIGMAQEVFPSYRALQRGPQSKEVEEERLSCFVAITLARETLTLTRSREYFGYGKRASQFLGEMGV